MDGFADPRRAERDRSASIAATSRRRVWSAIAAEADRRSDVPDPRSPALPAAGCRLRDRHGSRRVDHEPGRTAGRTRPPRRLRAGPGRRRRRHAVRSGRRERKRPPGRARCEVERPVEDRPSAGPPRFPGSSRGGFSAARRLGGDVRPRRFAERRRSLGRSTCRGRCRPADAHGNRVGPPVPVGQSKFGPDPPAGERDRRRDHERRLAAHAPDDEPLRREGSLVRAFPS